MADDIGVFVSGDRELEQRFDAFPQFLHGRLHDAIQQKTNELRARIEALVPRRTGKLASEIVESLTDTPDHITGRVSVSAEWAKAGALEYGGTGRRFKVSAHQMRLTHLWGRATAVPMLVEVPQSDRFTLIHAHRFMRGPLEAMRADVEEAMHEAVTGAEP
jgi:hypothetical protein